MVLSLVNSTVQGWTYSLRDRQLLLPCAHFTVLSIRLSTSVHCSCSYCSVGEVGQNSFCANDLVHYLVYHLSEVCNLY